jgi:valyl-tRNA synthetase
VIRHLARASRIDVQHNAAEPEGCGVRVLDSRTQIFLPLLHLGGGDHHQQTTAATSAEVSLSPENVANLQKEVEKMNKRKKKLEKEIEWIEQKVAGPYYLDKVPLDVRNQDKYGPPLLFMYYLFIIYYLLLINSLFVSLRCIRER